MPDEYDAIRRGLSNYERGLYFELGRAYIRGETADRGWVRQFKIETGKGSRIIDSARTEGLGIRAVERKSGRLNEREAREQLIRERAGIDSGKIARSDWETVAGEKIPRSVSNDMHALSRDFPGKFNHQVISRTDALRAIQVGRTLASKQLELVRVYELDRADRARKRLQNIREIVRQRERARELERQRERDERLQRAKERLPRVREAAERLRERRERQQRTRERLLLMRQTTERIRLPEPRTSGQRGREEHEAPGGGLARDVAELREVREYVEKVRTAREAADTVERERQEAATTAERERQEREAGERELRERRAAERDRKEREVADALLRARLPPDVTDLMLKGRPTPGLQSPHREPPSPGSTRGGRAGLARSRERGREGRGRER